MSKTRQSLGLAGFFSSLAGGNQQDWNPFSFVHSYRHLIDWAKAG